MYHVALFSEWFEEVASFEFRYESFGVSNFCGEHWDNLQRSRGGNFGSAAYSVGRRGVCNRYAAFTCVEGEASMKCWWNGPPGTWISVVVTRVKHEALLEDFSVVAPGNFASLGLYLGPGGIFSGTSHSV